MDKKAIRFLAILFIVVFWILAFFVVKSFAQHEHEFFTGDPFAVQWNAGDNALGYYWRVQRVSDGIVVAGDQTGSLRVSLSIQSAGIYIFYCRSWNFEEDGTTIRTSVWVNSLTHGLVDGAIRAWQIKIKLKPVGPLMIFDDRYDAP